MERTQTLPNREATENLARRLARLAKAGDAVMLKGPLGAGKSTFARAFLRELSGKPDLDVPSPTFTLIQSYDTPNGPVSHFDLWRLDGESALEEMGWDEAREGIVLVEWPDRLGSLTPEEALVVTLSPQPSVALSNVDDGDEPREVQLEGWKGRF